MEMQCISVLFVGEVLTCYLYIFYGIDQPELMLIKRVEHACSDIY